MKQEENYKIPHQTNVSKPSYPRNSVKEDRSKSNNTKNLKNTIHPYKYIWSFNPPAEVPKNLSTGSAPVSTQTSDAKIKRTRLVSVAVQTLMPWVQGSY